MRTCGYPPRPLPREPRSFTARGLRSGSALGQTERIVDEIDLRIERGDGIDPFDGSSPASNGLRKITSLPARRPCSADEVARSQGDDVAIADILDRPIVQVRRRAFGVAASKPEIKPAVRPPQVHGAHVSPTLKRSEIEAWLDQFLRNSGKARLNALRNQIKALAPTLALTEAAAELDAMIGALLGTRDAGLTSPVAKARARGASYDPSARRAERSRARTAAPS
jgi:hypothetical protein